MTPPDSQDLHQIAVDLRDAISGRVVENEPIAKLTSFRVGGPAAVLVEPAGAEDLAVVGAELAAHRLMPLILGRGTNVLVSDAGYSGVVIRLGRPFDWIEQHATDAALLEAGGATALPQVANRAAKLTLAGLEFAIAIPAAVGGAVRMNAGAHGTSVSDVLETTTVCRLMKGTLEVLTPAELEMGYRRTSLGSADVVTSAIFRLEPGDPKAIAEKMAAYRAHRTETQPVDAPNAGSMFRNPSGDTAGRLIEGAGLKGFRMGGAEVSSKHANFFLAHPGAKAQEIYDLMAEVQRIVEATSGVLLIPEVRTLGDF